MYKSKASAISKIEWARDNLDLGERISRNDVLEAYRRLSLAYHPDKCGEKRRKECEQRMKELNSAYRILLEYGEQYRVPVSREALQRDIIDPMERFADDWMWGKH